MPSRNTRVALASESPNVILNTPTTKILIHRRLHCQPRRQLSSSQRARDVSWGPEIQAFLGSVWRGTSNVQSHLRPLKKQPSPVNHTILSSTIDIVDNTNLEASTEAAVADFFKPISEKPKHRAIWGERCPEGDKLATLLVASYVPDGYDEKPVIKRGKVAAFDLDSTLIIPASGKKHASDANDWKWWNASVPSRVRKLYEDG